MKKIIILFISIFLITGCYDNIELDDLAIIGAVGIDYRNDEFIVTYEIYNSNKSQNSENQLSYTVTGSGKTIVEAFINTNYKTGKKAYYSHFKIMLISESIIDGHLEEIVDYLFRDTEIRDEFQLIITKDINPERILKHNSTKQPVVADLINDLLNLEKHNNNVATNESFKDILSKVIGKNEDIILNSISIINDNISLSDSFIFSSYVPKTTLSYDESSLYNLLKKNATNSIIVKEYDGKTFAININASICDIDITYDKIIIKSNLEARVIENNPIFNLKEYYTYEKLNAEFGILIKDKITELIKKLQQENSDILGFRKKYYQKYNKKLYDLWTTFNIDVTASLNINTKGFIFEVDNYE